MNKGWTTSREHDRDSDRRIVFALCVSISTRARESCNDGEHSKSPSRSDSVRFSRQRRRHLWKEWMETCEEKKWWLSYHSSKATLTLSLICIDLVNEIGISFAIATFVLFLVEKSPVKKLSSCLLACVLACLRACLRACFCVRRVKRTSIQDDYEATARKTWSKEVEGGESESDVRFNKLSVKN